MGRLWQIVGTAVASLAMACTAPLDPTPIDDAPEPESIAQSSTFAPCPDGYRIGPGFTPEQEASIRRAMDRWNAFANRRYFRVNERSWCHIGLDEYEANLPSRLTPEGWGAFADADTGRIVLHASVLAAKGLDTGPRFESVLMHEMGHHAGLEHIEGRGTGIMADGQIAEDFTEADRAECVRVQFCK